MTVTHYGSFEAILSIKTSEIQSNYSKNDEIMFRSKKKTTTLSLLFNNAWEDQPIFFIGGD